MRKRSYSFSPLPTPVKRALFIDFESKALHAGMLDLLGMEICDMLQIVAYDMPRGAADAPLIEIGMGTLDQNKGVLIAYGHNLAAGAEAMIYAENNNLWDKVDIGGVCCTAHDLNQDWPRKGRAESARWHRHQAQGRRSYGLVEKDDPLRSHGLRHGG